MSLEYRTERAFKALLYQEGVELQILSSQESSIGTLEPHRVVVQALRGDQITPKARNLRMTVLVHIETSADPGPDEEEADPADLAELRPEQHCENVDAVTAALLDRTDLAVKLSELCPARPFTCFGVVPQGQVYLKPDEKARVLRDSLSFVCTVAQQDTT